MKNINITLLFNKYQFWLKPEAMEQARLVLWLEDNGYTFTSIPNSTYTTSFKQKMVNFLTGLRPGLCDIMVIAHQKKLIFLEMKVPGAILKSGRRGSSKSKVGDNQKKWAEKLNSLDNVYAYFVYGCEDAKALLLSIDKKD